MLRFSNNLHLEQPVSQVEDCASILGVDICEEITIFECTYTTLAEPLHIKYVTLRCGRTNKQTFLPLHVVHLGECIVVKTFLREMD